MSNEKEISVEEKLRALYNLQQIHYKIDRIRTVRGELPLEVQDLEDEIVGLETRVNRLQDEMTELESQIGERKNSIKEAQAAIRKYEEQQSKVRNNREYDSITKELEFQNLEIQLSEKKIKEIKTSIAAKEEFIKSAKDNLSERQKDLEQKKLELKEIIDETQKEEDDLSARAKEAEKMIDARLITAYNRLRGNARNGLAVVAVERDSCGGCFNHIPPQRQLDIRMHKKIIVCEHCGRILVDKAINPETVEQH
ncbi:MAG: zinc ribbon domain-containing protein [Bacteroidota bacterium]